jgi:antitoxin (DNA-binding transcriptional repressor) of toxin-antitoxin stability system
MPTVNIYEAKTQLSRLLAAVDSGEEVVIARRGEPRWRLSLIDDEIPARIPGAWAGQGDDADDGNGVPVKLDGLSR